jgi:glutamate racemase
MTRPTARMMRKFAGERVLLLATRATVESGIYREALWSIVALDELPVPELAGAIEQEEPPATIRSIIREALQTRKGTAYDKILLGCTHYPLLKPLLGEILGQDVVLIDSAHETAAETARVLGSRGLLAPGGEPNERPSHRFIASDAPNHFLRLGQRFLGSTIECVEHLTLG